MRQNRTSAARFSSPPATVRSLTLTVAERAAADAARKRVTVVVRLADDLRAPPTSHRHLRHALALLVDDAVQRAPRGTTVLVVARRSADAIAFEVRDADMTQRSRMRPAHRRARLAAPARWGFRVATDPWAGTRAIIALPQPGRRSGRRSRWMTCVFSADDNLVMQGSAAVLRGPA